MLIIIKFDMFETSRTALLSVLILFIRLKFLTLLCWQGMFSGFRSLGLLLGSSSRSRNPIQCLVCAQVKSLAQSLNLFITMADAGV